MIQNQEVSLLSQPETPTINRSPQSFSSSSQQPDRLEHKIETMARALAQVGTVNTSKSMQNLQSMQKEREKCSHEERQCYKAMLEEINSIQKTIISLDRDRMMRNSHQKITQEQLYRVIAQCQCELRRLREDNHESLSDFSDKISTLKVQMVERESENRERAGKLEREAQLKLGSMEEQPAGSPPFFQKFKKEFRTLRAAVDEHTRSAQKEANKQQARLLGLRGEWQRKVQEQRNKQKVSFQRNYQALEAIFKLMSEEL